jgi:hypothetical protein
VAALPCAVPPIAWGLRRAPLAGWALGALTLAASLWLALTATGRRPSQMRRGDRWWRRGRSGLWWRW